MEKTITEHVIKLSGKATLLEPIDLSEKYKVLVDGSVVEVSDADNEDGTYTRYYKYKPALVSVVSELGEVIKTKDIRSRSKQLRAVLYREWQDQNDQPISSEDYYDKRMQEIIKAVIEGKI